MAKRPRSKNRRRKHRSTRGHARPTRELERPTVVQAMAQNSRESKDRLGLRGDRFTELLAKTVEVSEDDTYLVQRSGLTPKEHQELLRLAPEFAEGYEQELDDRCTSFLKKLVGVEPLPIVATFMMNNIFGTAGEYFEPLATGRESKVEYVVSCLAAVDSTRSSGFEEPSRELLIELTDDVDEILELAHLANLARGMATDPNDPETDLRFRSRAHRLVVRGSSYAQHGRELARAVFGSLPAQVVQKIGFDVEQVIEVDEQVTRLVQLRANAFLDGLRHRLLEVVGVPHADFAPTPEQLTEIKGIFNERPTDALVFTLDDFEANGSVVRAMLETLSVPLSEGAGPPYRSPWDSSVLAHRPFVRRGNRYMLPVPGILSREMATVMESHVEPHLSTFKDWRAKKLDQIAVGHLERMLPGARSWTSLYYRIDENGQTKRVELDALVLYEGVAFLLEGKANPLAPPSLRGDVRRLRSQIKETVQKAFHQALRARDYLLSGKVAFEDERGNIVLQIDGTELDRIYIINPTLHELGDQAVQLGRFQELGLFQDGTLPFSVFVNDLRVISEIVEVPMEFIHYLEWRARLPLGTTIDVNDELDLFGAYLVRQQLDRMIATFGYVQVGNSSTDFDDYFMGQVPRKKRPRMLMLLSELRDFLARMSRERPEGWMDAVGTCLELSLAETAIVSGTLRRMPEVEAGRMAIGVYDTDPLADPNGGGVSLAIVLMGEGVDGAEVRALSGADLPDVQRVVFLRRSSRNRPMVEWATTKPGLEVKLDERWSSSDNTSVAEEMKGKASSD